MSHAILSVGIHGASGRMGTRLIQLIALDPTLKLAAALERAGHPHLGADAGALAAVAPLGIALHSSLPADRLIDVMIDFSLPHATLGVAESCRERGIPLVVGTTGFDAGERKLLESSSTRIPMLIAPNMSRAVNLLMRLVAEAARSLGKTADVAIVERHHRTKKDAPSGTALRLAECARHGSVSSSQRGQPADGSESEISMHALRIADSPGEHTVIFAMLGETLELSHRALNRDGFARGALEAAKFLAGKPPGLYSMEDVLICP
ncbi:MAG: 4-hydroxy-tetrahydrodipicolinate reductase [Isosphaerales bacterium]